MQLKSQKNRLDKNCIVLSCNKQLPTLCKLTLSIHHFTIIKYGEYSLIVLGIFYFYSTSANRKCTIYVLMYVRLVYWFWLFCSRIIRFNTFTGGTCLCKCLPNKIHIHNIKYDMLICWLLNICSRIRDLEASVYNNISNIKLLVILSFKYT